MFEPVLEPKGIQNRSCPIPKAEREPTVSNCRAPPHLLHCRSHQSLSCGIPRAQRSLADSHKCVWEKRVLSPASNRGCLVIEPESWVINTKEGTHSRRLLCESSTNAKLFTATCSSFRNSHRLSCQSRLLSPHPAAAVFHRPKDTHATSEHKILCKPSFGSSPRKLLIS